MPDQPRLTRSHVTIPGPRRVFQFEDTAHSGYNGLIATVNKRFGSGFQFGASYTWSHSIDDSSDQRAPGCAPQNVPASGDDALTDDHPSGVKSAVPIDTEILPVDFGGRKPLKRWAWGSPPPPLGPPGELAEMPAPLFFCPRGRLAV